jgi:hypothetical protein
MGDMSFHEVMMEIECVFSWRACFSGVKEMCKNSLHGVERR